MSAFVCLNIRLSVLAVAVTRACLNESVCGQLQVGANGKRCFHNIVSLALRRLV